MNSKVLNEHLKGVADAIREKKGSSDLINPQDFAKEIASIEGGGGESGESGGSNYIYYDQKKALMNIKWLWEYSSTIKVNLGGQYAVLRTIEVRDDIKENGMEEYIIAVCIDPTIKFQTMANTPLLTWIEQDPTLFETVNEARITEEEYFNLNV